MSRFRIHCANSNAGLWEDFVTAHKRHYGTPPYGLWEERQVRQLMELFRNKSS